MSDDAIFTIESWLRRSDIDVPPGKREQLARHIYFKMVTAQQREFFEHKAIPRGLIDERVTYE